MFVGQCLIPLDGSLQTYLKRGARRPLDVLDFGCGTGSFLKYLDRFGTVSGVDSDPDAVAFCHERGRTEVRHVAPGAPLPFADSSFDLVTTLDVIEHVADDIATLCELRRVLRPDGLALVAVPAFMFLWGDQDVISHHFRRYTARGLRSSLQIAGFRVTRTSYFNTWLFAPIAALRLARRPANAFRRSVKNRECECPLANASYTNILMDPGSLVRVGAHALRGAMAARGSR